MANFTYLYSGYLAAIIKLEIFNFLSCAFMLIAFAPSATGLCTCKAADFCFCQKNMREFYLPASA